MRTEKVTKSQLETIVSKMVKAEVKKVLAENQELNDLVSKVNKFAFEDNARENYPLLKPVFTKYGYNVAGGWATGSEADLMLRMELHEAEKVGISCAITVLIKDGKIIEVKLSSGAITNISAATNFLNSLEFEIPKMLKECVSIINNK